MGVDSRIRGTDQVIWEDVGKNYGEDSVLKNPVRAVFIKVDDEEGIVHEMGVVEECGDEWEQPIRTICDLSVVCIVKLVRGDEDMLRKLIIGKILLERNEVFDCVDPFWLVNIAVEQNRWVVLPDIVVGTIALVEKLESLKSSIWKVLLVGSEGDTLGGQQIPDVRHIGRDLMEVVIIHPEIVTTVDGTIVGLGWMGDTEIVAEGETLGREALDIC